jgi:glycosyltransferase involved in cell wall biosynthesis
MRILLILHQFFPEFCGGTERVALNLAKAAQRAGHHVNVLACIINPANSDGRPSKNLAGALQTVYEGIPLILLPREQFPSSADFSFDSDPRLVTKLTTWMKSERFEIAHVLHPMRMGSAFLATQRSKLPYILTLTDFFYACYRINQINLNDRICQGPNGGAQCAKDCLVGPWSHNSLAGRYRQANDLLSSAGVRVCPSEYVANSYRESFPGLEFSVIPHGVDIISLAGDGTPPLKPDKRCLTLGYVGPIIKQKGLDILLRAIVKVPDPSVKLYIVGGSYGDPVYHFEVKRLVEADSRVEMLGQVSQVRLFEIIKTFDLLCLPSRVPETFSLVLQEAATAGVPAFVSDIGAPAERITQMGGGRVLPTGNVDSWADAISELAAHPDLLVAWRNELQLPLRIEEEAFFYESLYRRLLRRV